MKIDKIKPIPKYILEMIKRKDKKVYPKQDFCLRFYSYLTKNDGELVQVTVAVKNKKKNWYAKQVIIHGVHSDKCFVKDIETHYIAGYLVGWQDMGLYTGRKWYEDGKWYTCDDSYFHPFAPIVNRNYITKFPEYKYSAFELYKGFDAIKYLRIYEAHPGIEYLMKMGIDSCYALSIQILRKCEKDKHFRKWLSQHKYELSYSSFYISYYISTVLNAYKNNTGLQETQEYESQKKALVIDSDYKPIREMLCGDYKSYFTYISKQGISNRLYLDYLKACNYLELDMSEDKNRYPHDFRYWHDTRINEYKTARAEKDEKEREEMYKRFASVAEKYMSMQHNKKSAFIAVIAKSPAELINEGYMLHHCVGRMGYDQKFINEQTLIFFIRSKDAPDIPLVTVEYSISRKRVLQCYADDNTTPADDILHYVNKVWLPYANKALKQIAA